jgi:hypothetical protein
VDEKGKTHVNFVWETFGKHILRVSKTSWEDNIKLCVKQTVCELKISGEYQLILNKVIC